MGRAVGGAACAWLLAILGVGSAAAQAVAVVKTADNIPAFETAIEGLKRSSGADLSAESLDADAARWPKVQEKLGKKSPAVWVPVGPLALKEAAAAGLSEPIVFMMVATPENALSGGEGNVAGVTMRLGSDVQLRKVRALLPSAKKLGMLYDPGQATSVKEVDEARTAATGLGFELVVMTMSAPRELGSALQSVLDQEVDALWLIADRTVTPPKNEDAFKYIVETSTKSGVPVIGYAEKLTQRGALFSLSPDFEDIGVQAGELVKKVAAGADPAGIGIQPARKVALSVNKRVASTLGIDMSGDAVAGATVFD